MKKRQRKIAALLLACVMTCLPVSQAFAETSYDTSAGVESQVLFPNDSLTGITGVVTVDGAEASLSGEGTWTNTDESKVYKASMAEDGSIQITQAGYVLVVKQGTSSRKKGDQDSNHYQYGDWEQPDGSVDRAYYAGGTAVKLKADDPADGMEFKGWTCDTEGVTLKDPTSPETTFKMPEKKVTITAEYQEKQPEEVPQETQQEVPQETSQEVPQESVTYTVNVENGEASGNFLPGEWITVTANDRAEEGLAFAGWVSSQNAQLDDVSASTTGFLMPDGDVSLTATYQEIPQVEYTLTVNNGVSDQTSYVAGDRVTVTANDRTGENLEFAGWYAESGNVVIENSLIMTAEIVMPEGDVILTATYEEMQAEEPVTEESESNVEEPGTEEPESNVEEPGTEEPESNVEEPGTEEPESNAEEPGTEEPGSNVEEPGTEDPGSNVEEPGTEDPGVNVEEPGTEDPGVNVEEPGTEGPGVNVEVPGTEDPGVNVEAPGTEEPPVNAEEPGAGTPAVNAEEPGTEEPGVSVTEPETDVSDIPVEIETDAPADAEPETEPSVAKYTVTVENGGNGSGDFAAGSTVTVEAAAELEDGRIFDSWKTGNANLIFADASQAVTSFVMPAEAVTVTPQYVVPRTVKVDENTTIVPSAEELKTAGAGTQITVTAKEHSADGKNFVKWTAKAAKGEDAVEVLFADAAAMTTTFTLPDCDSIAITANYADAPKTYKVTVANGLINNASTELICEVNTEITVTANPSPSGQAFSHWTINDGTYDIGEAMYDQTIHLTVTDQDLAIRAEYEGIEYEITVNDGSSDYDMCASGTVVTILADDAPEGYEFDYWTVDSQNAFLADAYSDVTTFEMPDQDVTVSAHYKKMAYKVYVENGSADQAQYYAGDTVTVKSNYPASGRVFSKWETVNGKASFADASRWKTTFKMPANDVAVRAVYKDGPSTNDNVILELVAGGEYYIGDTIKFTASGAGMANTAPNPGDYRYRPSGYQIGNVTGTLQSPYSISMAINASGEYTLKVTFNKDIYDGSNWVSDGTADTKTVNFRVIKKAAGVATGDETPLAAVIAIAVVSCAVFVLLLVVYIRRRRK